MRLFSTYFLLPPLLVRGFILYSFLLCIGISTTSLFAQDSESFFDDDLPEDNSSSDSLKSKPIELRGDDDAKRKAAQQTDEKGQAIEAPKPKITGPTEQVAPMASRPSETVLDNSRFSLGGNYFMNVGRGISKLPSGFGAFLGYDADESHGRGFDLRLEAGFLNITKGDNSITGGYFEMGPTWIYRPGKFPLQFLTAILPGIGYYDFKDAVSAQNAVKFTAHVALGVEFPFLIKRLDRTDEFVPFIHLRTGMIYDTELPFVQYGVYGGIAYKFGQVIFKY
ncbi:MAG TPA: hypothetical protein PLY93_11560 [Turneriella sp.]|nr:hypothetical protein [Turneriella sp.]